ncbi:HAD family hydrolase [Paenibacillus sp. GCM10012307]|uniref:HAD family hydrolase n=1 Tax=Paenibacillus roseus TaxID=2798579 RepID=A0A934J0N4_9BACL|nr:HAD family hydrolase [Paenibacillus roseus]MBJ6362671.1 HAD family hydrolase [Paenibacillus roseus]
MDLTRIRWIFFDLGDTLLDESAAADDVIGQYVRNANRLGYKISKEDMCERLTYYFREMTEIPIRPVLEELVSSTEHWHAIREGVKYNKQLEQPFPGVEPMLRRLSAQYRLGVIANQSLGTLDRLKSYKLDSYFSLMGSSAELGMNKPDPRFFQWALKEADCRPAEAVMIGDRIDNDIIPARQLGLHAIWVKQGFAKVQPLPAGELAPDYILNHILDLEPLLTKE